MTVCSFIYQNTKLLQVYTNAENSLSQNHWRTTKAKISEHDENPLSKSLHKYCVKKSARDRIRQTCVCSYTRPVCVCVCGLSLEADEQMSLTYLEQATEICNVILFGGLHFLLRCTLLIFFLCNSTGLKIAMIVMSWGFSKPQEFFSFCWVEQKREEIIHLLLYRLCTV